MNPVRAGVHAVIALACISIPVAFAIGWVWSAEDRLVENDAAAAQPQAAVAAASDVGYCTPTLKRILRRVVQSCGLLSSGEVRGCQPLAAKAITVMAGEDFNALFLPLADRAAIVQFDKNADALDPAGEALLDTEFADQKGASYFLVVARASPEGSETDNRDLSQRRGNAVLEHLRTKFQDPDLDHEIGLLWLGEDASSQLDQQFCQWKRSRGGDCDLADLNRSAFITWIDCTL